MINISLTDFLDFVSATGSPKLTKVRQIKNRKPYKPHFDHWKDLREAIITYHAGDYEKAYFDSFLLTVLDAKKRESYRPLIEKYKTFLGRKNCQTLDHENTVWTYGELSVSVNPELCLLINNEKYLIKLYFKAKEISKLKVEVILFLMKHALPIIEDVDYYTILDVHHNKPIKVANPDDSLEPLLFAEAQHFITLYNSLP